MTPGDLRQAAVTASVGSQGQASAMEWGDAMALLSDENVAGLLFAIIAVDLGLGTPHDLVQAVETALTSEAGDADSIRAVFTAVAGLGDTETATVDKALAEQLASASGDPRRALQAAGGISPSVHTQLPRTVTMGLASQGIAPLGALRESPAGRYVNFEPVGSGGMGIVYLVLDTDLNRQVAFKMVNPKAFSREAFDAAAPALHELPAPAAGAADGAAYSRLKARFLQEALITGNLSHPAIVPVYEVGQTLGGMPYYTMKFVHGRLTFAEEIQAAETLEDRLALLEPFLAVCDAVSYAHEKGVIHRDLKPQNVQRGSFGETVLLDWGLARTRDPAQDAADERWRQRIADLRGESGLRTLGTLGTPGYMAPECFSGDPHRVDKASDQYSLGAMLFQLLTGRLPHPLDTAGGEGPDFSVYARTVQLHDAPTATEVDPHIPAELSAICACALRRVPAERYDSVGALASSIRTWQRESARRQRRAERRAFASKVGMLAACLLLFAVGVFWWRTDFLRREADLQRRRAEAQSYELTVQKAALIRRIDDAYHAAYRRFSSQGDRVGQILVAATAKAHARRNDMLSLYDWEGLGRIPLGDHPTLAGIIRTDFDWTCAIFSPEGDRVVAGDTSGFLRVTDSKTGAQEIAIKAHRGRVTGVAFAGPHTLVSCGVDGSVLRWDVRRRENTPIQPAGSRPVSALSVSRDARWVCWAQRGGSTRVARLGGGGSSVVLEVSRGNSFVGALSPDGSLLAAADGHRVYLWDVQSGNRLGDPQVHLTPPKVLSFSPDGTWLASGGSDNVVKVWRVRDVLGRDASGPAPRAGEASGPASHCELRGHSDMVTGLAFIVGTDQLLASSSLDGTVRVWCISDGSLRCRIRAHKAGIAGLAVSSDDTLLTLGRDRTARAWDLSAGGDCMRLRGHDGAATDVVYMPKGPLVASCGIDGSICFWDVVSGRCVSVLTGPGSPALAIAPHPDGALFASGHRDGSLCLWDLASQRLARRLPGHSGRVECVSFSPAGELLASGGFDDTIRLWDPVTGLEIDAIRGYATHVKALTFSPDGERLLWGSWDGTVRVWILEERRELHCLRDDGAAVMSICCVSAEGTGLSSDTVAIGTHGGCLRLWDGVSGVPKGDPLDAHRAAVCRVGLSDDGLRLFSAGWDGEVKVWEVASRRLLQTLVAQGGGVRCLSVSPAGGQVAAGVEDGGVMIWDLCNRDLPSVADVQRLTGAWLVGFDVQAWSEFLVRRAVATDPFLCLRWSVDNANHWRARAAAREPDAMHHLALISERQQRDEQARRLHAAVMQTTDSAAESWRVASLARMQAMPWLAPGATSAHVAGASGIPTRTAETTGAGDAEALHRQALLLEQDQRFEEARTCHTRVTEDVDSADAHWARASRRRLVRLPWLIAPRRYGIRMEVLRRWRSGDRAGALRHCAVLAAIDAEEGRRLTLYLADDLCAQAKGRAVTEALALLEEAVSLCPTSVRVRRILAKELDRSGQRGAALHQLHEARALPGISGRALGELAWDLNTFGHRAAAIEVGDRALALDDSLSFVHCNQTVLKLLSDDLSGAMTHVTWLNRHAPGWRAAVAHDVESWLSREPRLKQAHYLLGYLYDQLGERTLARTHYGTYAYRVKSGVYHERARQRYEELDPRGRE